MILEWFNAREAAEVGAALADLFAPPPDSDLATRGKQRKQSLEEFLQHADNQVRSLKLNVYKKTKFASSFKWRLLENGVSKDIADELTQRLVLQISLSRANSALLQNSAVQTDRFYSINAKLLFAQGNKCVARGDHAEAITFYQDLIELDAHHALGLNNLGATYCKLGRYKAAAKCFQQAIGIDPNYAEAHGNLGNIFRWRGELAEAEIWLRRAIKLNPNLGDARNSLGLTLSSQGRVRDAMAQFKKGLKIAPRSADALFGMGYIAAVEGCFDKAEVMFRRALAINPKMPSAWASLAGLRKMTRSDGSWLEGAQEIVADLSAPLEAAELRFAMGKYYDDIEDFERAFQSYKSANELQKAIAENYDRDARTRFVNDLIRTYSRESIARLEDCPSPSMQAVFVVGMPRSGTSLVEQIIASHPSARGAGEQEFWAASVREHEATVRQRILGEPLRKKLAEAYLRALAEHSGDAPRIVDKAPLNSDYLGVIHSVFPNARIIYMRRDPIDTCLSCYFQRFSPILNFAMDLSDLAHYYREHQRLMMHWLAVLRPGTILDVPYEGLVADQVGWICKILDFLNLEWDDRCLDFHQTKRPVVTSSYWQVRQKIYNDSVKRWHKYRKFITPLLSLRDLNR